jgi:hypothetical protein
MYWSCSICSQWHKQLNVIPYTVCRCTYEYGQSLSEKGYPASALNFVFSLKKTVILPSRNLHIYWPLFLMQITTPSSPDTLRYKVWFPSFDLEQTDNWGTFGLGRRLRNIFNFSHERFGRILRNHYIVLPSLSFEIVKCCLMFKFGVRSNFPLFLLTFEEHLKKANLGSGKHWTLLQVCVEIAIW